MTNGSIRALKASESKALVDLLDAAFGSFHSPVETRRQLSSGNFDPAHCFVTGKPGVLDASIALTRLPRDGWFVIRYLALRDIQRKNNVGRKLVQTALHAARAQRAEYLRSTTPRLEPYVNLYERGGFRPVRRDFRIRWKIPKDKRAREENVTLRPVVGDETETAATEAWVRSIRDIWEWRTTEQGGEERVARRFREELGRGQKWMLAHHDDKIVGLTGLIPNDGGPGKARFRGAYVIPEHRGLGYGTAVMQATFNWARDLGQNEMTIYTFSPLNGYAPGAALYLKSGGILESEYLQLEYPIRQ